MTFSVLIYDTLRYLPRREKKGLGVCCSFEIYSFYSCLLKYLVLELLSYTRQKMAPNFLLIAKTLKNILFDLVLSATDSGTDIAAAYWFFK